MDKDIKKTVFVGMSGGVDSSISAALLKKQGYNVVGVFIKTWHPNFIACNEEEERLDAMRVAAHLDIPFLTFDFENIYKKEVADYMISEYKKGNTPNPDVMCNKEIKFGAFLRKAINMGADYIATGHYAQNKKFSGKEFLSLRPLKHKAGDPRFLKFFPENFLLKGEDPSKDQSYFLWTIKKEQLSRIIFPIGHLNKTDVRILAKKLKIPVAEKKDSQGICFLGAIDLKDFLKHYIKEKKGKVVNENNEEIGYHNGAVFYTLGERHGFTIIKKSPTDIPYYIIAKDIKKNILIVSQNKNSNKFNSTKNSFFNFNLKNINWISIIPKYNKIYTAQIRYHGEFLPCKIKNIKKNTAEIIFKKYTLVDKGQSCVIYDKDICLGGGVIV